MTIDLPHILHKSCPFRTPEMAFQRIKILKFLVGERIPEALKGWPVRRSRDSSGTENIS